MSFMIEGCHSMSFTTLSLFLFEDTSPDGKSPSTPPAARCSLAIFSPPRLLFIPGRSVKGFTGKKWSARLGIYDRIKFVRILRSGRFLPRMLSIITPSTAPNGWFDTIMKGCPWGRYSSSSGRKSQETLRCSSSLSAKSIPWYWCMWL